MKPGKKPMTTAMKMLTGNERYINKDMPKTEELESLEPPEWLTGVAREKYLELAPKLSKLGILKETGHGYL